MRLFGVCALVSLSLVVPEALSATQEEIVSAHQASGLDPADISLTLTRTICLGSCPVYSVRIDGTGEVQYEGRQYVKTTGAQRGKIPQEDALRLVNELLRARFFDADQEYQGTDRAYLYNGKVLLGRAVIQDANAVILSLELGKHQKTVRVYHADPLGLGEIAAHIDAAVQIEQWIGTWCERPRSSMGPHLQPGECDPR